jgi:hypothetical protein
MKTVNKSILVALFLFSGVVAFAEPIADPFGGGDPGGGGTPINDYIIPMLLVVLVFGYRVLIVKNREHKQTVSK